MHGQWPADLCARWWRSGEGARCGQCHKFWYTYHDVIHAMKLAFMCWLCWLMASTEMADAIRRGFFVGMCEMNNEQPVSRSSIDDPDSAVLPYAPGDQITHALHVPARGQTPRSWRLAVLYPILLIALGAAIGANMRYFISQWAGQLYGTTFPYGT